jgi:hypothetical protein
VAGRLADWQLPASVIEAAARKFSGLNASDPVALAFHPKDIHAGKQAGHPGSRTGAGLS